MLASPLIAASGCAGSVEHRPEGSWLAGLGAWTTPTITPGPRPGRPGVRIAETPAGLIYQTTWPNPGIDETGVLLSRGRPEQAVPVIVSIGADSAEAAAAIVNALSGVPAVAAVELNLAWPGIDAADAEAPDVLAAWVAAAALVSEVPVIVKLSPCTDIIEAAMIAAASGADAVTIAHGWPALSGTLAGPAILPMTLRLVAAVARATDVAVIGCGGVRSAADVQAYLDAGAVAVQVGSVLLRDPTAGARIAADLTLLSHP
ncbi:MAG: nitronate monooxygenase [Dehalococcoidia bacterium]